MKVRILGIDTGTNSLGWAIVDYDTEAIENKYKLIDTGVNIFQEGVKIDKGRPSSSRATERTGYRRQRIGYWRRKIRKIELLRFLIDKGLCPPLSNEELKLWRKSGKYPTNDAFMEWQSTNDANKNPYYCRNLCLTQKLDWEHNLYDSYVLGRALYHINQRRGFLSNRKEDTSESEGKVKDSIDELTKKMQDEGFKYLGQYFYSSYQKGNKIRNHYTSRLEHYAEELKAICRMQNISEEDEKKLYEIIITQRPLKSQKQNVGKCVLETKKKRCPMSHPLFEQYRMYAFINNIKVQGPEDDGLRFLTKEEKDSIIPLFLRKSAKHFKFEEIAKKISGKNNSYGYYKDGVKYGYCFNYSNNTSLKGCSMIAELSDVYEVKSKIDINGWLDKAMGKYVLDRTKNGQKKTHYEVMNDIWHVLHYFDNEEKKKEFAKNNLRLNDAQATKFSKIHISSNYSSLSLKAIRKVLPYMKYCGLIESHAIFMGNLNILFPYDKDEDTLLPMIPLKDAEKISLYFKEWVEDHSKKEEDRDIKLSLQEYFKSRIADVYKLDDNERIKLNQLYHPSMVEAFRKVEQNPQGYYQLESPRKGSIKNPMAMHSLFRLRKVINSLLKERKIDSETIVHIEFSRGLNDSNMRAAIFEMQKDNEENKKKIVKDIKELLNDESYEPTDIEILKYKLWKEQGTICLYTNEHINITDLLSSQKYDIEHTIPRSVGGDFTQMNLTICNSEFNRKTKQTKIPSELENHEEILERISSWKKTIEGLEKSVYNLNMAKDAITEKEAKDTKIKELHKKKMELAYWKGKYERFTMTKVPEGFSLRQGTDATVISKFARQYLKSLFHKVYVVKGITTNEFRKIWGLQEEYTKKQRINHCHHAIDAITIACIGEAEYNRLAFYYHDKERYKWELNNKRAVFPKPWKTFTEDVKCINETLLVSHYTADNMSKPTRRKKRVNGKVVKGQYIQGDTARASLHQDTYYGAISHNGEIRYVIRKSIDQLIDKTKAKEEANIDKIVDDVVRKKVKEAYDKHGRLKMAKGDIWMNEEKQIPINKVRVYAHTNKPMQIRQHRDISDKDYKRTFNVVNDSNYILGIYVGKNKKGNEERSFNLVNSLDAVKHFNGRKEGEELLPLEKDGQKLKCKLKIGTMVLLYENTPNEIYNLKQDKSELCKRLFKVYALEKDGRVRLIFHQEARNKEELGKELKNKLKGPLFTKFTQGEKMMPLKRISLSNFNALVEGYDFIINDIGEITFLKND